MYVVYMLWSDELERFYLGITNNLSRRLRQHNGEIAGGAKATRAGRPWRCVFKHFCGIKGEAMRKEASLKKLSHAQKMKLEGVEIQCRSGLTSEDFNNYL